MVKTITRYCSCEGSKKGKGLGGGGGCKLVLSFKVLITESCRENTRANLKLESPFSSYGSYDGRGGGPHYIHKQKCGELV